MKKLSLLLAIMMLLSSLVFPAMAEEPEVIKESASGFYYIEANGDQVRLSAADKEIFFQADGLWFKDLNGNGALDIYEDWRQDINARVADLLSQMTPEEKGGTLIFACVAGKNGSTVYNHTVIIVAVRRSDLINFPQIVTAYSTVFKSIAAS